MDKYGNIAENILQLISSLLIHKDECGTSPLKEKKSQQQLHGFDDTTIAFVSTDKRNITKWHKLIFD